MPRHKRYRPRFHGASKLRSGGAYRGLRRRLSKLRSKGRPKSMRVHKPYSGPRLYDRGKAHRKRRR